jgi:hypothetical protein
VTIGNTAGTYILKVSGIETLVGTAAAETVTLLAANSKISVDGIATLTGSSSSDIITFVTNPANTKYAPGSTTAADTLIGISGSADTITLSTASKIVFRGDSTTEDVIIGSNLTDTIVLSTASIIKYDSGYAVGNKQDQITGSAGIDTITLNAATSIYYAGGSASATDKIIDRSGASSDGSGVVTITLTLPSSISIDLVDTLTGSAGVDTVTLAAATTTRMENIEVVTGSTGVDNIVLAGTVKLKFDGNGGSDVITGTSSADAITLTGGTTLKYHVNTGTTLTTDVITGSSEQDTITFAVSSQIKYSPGDTLGTDQLTGSSSVDTLILMTASSIQYQSSGTVTDTISGSAGVDTVTFTAASKVTFSGVETITGHTGNDTITINGSTGAFVKGNGGADTFRGGNGKDTFVFSDTTADTVTNFAPGSSGDVLSFKTALATFNSGGGTDIAAGDTPVLVSVAPGTKTLGASDNIIVLTGATYANAAAVKTAIGGGTAAVTWAANPTANDAILVAWTDGSDGHVTAIKDANTTSTAAMVAGELTAIDLVTLTGLSNIENLVAANFAFSSDKDTFVFSDSTTEKTVSFVKGSGGDVLSFKTTLATFNSGDGTDIAAGDTPVLVEVAGATTLGANDNIIVLTGTTYANAAAVKTAIGGGTAKVTWAAAPTTNDSILVVWTDGSNGHVTAIKDADTAPITAAMESDDLTLTDLAILTGLTSIAAGDFVAANFAFS